MTRFIEGKRCRNPCCFPSGLTTELPTTIQFARSMPLSMRLIWPNWASARSQADDLWRQGRRSLQQGRLHLHRER